MLTSTIEGFIGTLMAVGCAAALLVALAALAVLAVQRSNRRSKRRNHYHE